jgi:TRAP-type C4-dicarboxylate transport system substrate-binding protein
VPETPLSLETFKVLGANAFPMAWPDVVTGIQQGTIEAYDNPIPGTLSNRAWDLVPYLSITNHFFNPVDLVISRSVWDKLDPDIQALFEQAGQEASTQHRAYSEENMARMLEEIIANGMKVNTDVNIDAFQKACMPVWEVFRNQIGSDILDETIALATTE